MPLCALQELHGPPSAPQASPVPPSGLAVSFMLTHGLCSLAQPGFARTPRCWACGRLPTYLRSGSRLGGRSYALDSPRPQAAWTPFTHKPGSQNITPLKGAEQRVDTEL